MGNEKMNTKVRRFRVYKFRVNNNFKLSTFNSQLSTQCGFTLVEMILVIFIMLLMASAVAPSLKNYLFTTRLRTATKQIVSLVNYARSLSISQKVKYRVNFDLDSERCWLSKAEQDLSGKERYVRLSNSWGRTHTLPEGIDIYLIRTPRSRINKDSGTDYIVFKPNGSSEDSAIYIKNSKGNVRTLIVDGFTGRIRIR